MMQIAVHGTGRMAEAICDVADGITLAGLVGRSQPAWKTSVPHFQQLNDLPNRPDFLIDFTLPAGTCSAAEWCQHNGVALVSGVTGLDTAAQNALDQASRSVPVLWSPNLSVGVNLLALLVGQAASALPESTPVLVDDVHHQWKKDAPSGTALMLGQAVQQQRGGVDQAIRYESTREGEVIGDHTVTFTLPGETLELAHRAQDRSIYARGAIAAGQWLQRQTPGRYQANDWLAGLLGTEC